MRGGVDTGTDRSKNTSDQGAMGGQNNKNMAGNAMGAVKDEARSAMNAVTNFAGEAKDKVQEWSNDAMGTAKNAGEAVQRWAGDAYEGAASTMKNFGGEATDLVKKYPIQSVLIGFGVGVLIGRAART